MARGYTQDQDDIYDWPTAKDFLEEDIYNEIEQDWLSDNSDNADDFAWEDSNETK